MRRRGPKASARLTADVHSFARPVPGKQKGDHEKSRGKKISIFRAADCAEGELWTQYYQYWYGLARECWDASRDPSSRRLVSTTARAHPARNRKLW